MTSFIVISTDNRLHYLVDGIQQCRPLNNSIPLAISTGKIIHSEGEYVYRYDVAGEDSSNTGTKRLTHLLSNQLSLFRKTYGLGDSLVNIFLLENPLCVDDLNIGRSWIEEIEEVYESGLDRSINLYRVILAYNPLKTTSISEQGDASALKALIDEHCARLQKKQDALDEYVFFIDNQDCDAAAVSISNKDHDFKLPRFLMDIMSVISSENDSYNVRNAVIAGNTNTRCFSAGYAESMYYYPDIEEYFRHAEKRDFYKYILDAEDERFGLENNDLAALNPDFFPIGLRNRKDHYSKIYGNVPFNEDIHEKSWSESADKLIDEHIVSMRDLIEKRNSGKYEDNPDEDCLPCYVDRSIIEEKLKFADDNELSDLNEELSNEYSNLLSSLCSKEFYEYAKLNDSESNEPMILTPNEPIKKGCLRLPFAKKNNKKELMERSTQHPIVKYTKLVKQIKNLSECKKKYSQFCEFIGDIETKYKREKYICDNFTLSQHTNHYFPLIDLDKLKEFHSSGLKKRMSGNIEEWKNDENGNFDSLLNIVGLTIDDYAKRFKYINWDNPAPFIVELSTENNLYDICNKLHRKSTPFVNYNINPAMLQTRITKMLFSDRPDFDKEVEKMKKDKLYHGTEIIGYRSPHIASKICMIQVLPMDTDILENLVKISGNGGLLS